jgi:protein TonB
MEADKVTATETRVPLAAAPAAAAAAQDRVFWIGLACASVLHAALLVEASRSASLRQMGEKGGQPDGISVELIDAADLKAKNSFAEAGAPKGAEAPQRKAIDKSKADKAEQKSADPAEQKPPEAKPAEPAETKTAALAPPQEKPAPPKIEMELKAPSSPFALAPEALEKLPPPAQGAKPSEPAPKAVPKPQKDARLKLDFTMPDTPTIPGPGGAAMSRPAGYTRSGENDEFGRGVIRALRKTLPRPRDMRGRVTVRFLISPNGDLVEVQLLRSGGIPRLDQEVVFSVKQASFPFPPRNAPPVDRTFLVTYIYH